MIDLVIALVICLVAALALTIRNPQAAWPRKRDRLDAFLAVV